MRNGLILALGCALVLSICTTLCGFMVTSAFQVVDVSSLRAGPPPAEVEPPAVHTLTHISSVAGNLASHALGKLRNASQRLLSGCPKDEDPDCVRWASLGECDKNPDFMHKSCATSCHSCHKTNSGARCEDKSSFCGQWAAVGECHSNPIYMSLNCPVTCHLCQSEQCHDSDPTQCASRALDGECRRAPEKMYDECRSAAIPCFRAASACDVNAATHGMLQFTFTHSLACFRPLYGPPVGGRASGARW